MCKLMCFSNITKFDLNKLEKLTKAVVKVMASERDGFGITLCNAQKVLSARKFLKPSEASLISPVTPPAPYLKALSEEIGGPISPDNESIIFHGRTSTNEVSLRNTHPIIKHGLWLSHNGVVEDHGPAYSKMTSNDTEHIVERLGTGGVEAVEKFLSGYYATIHYDESQPGVLTVVKDNIAPLFFSKIDALDSIVFATTASMIESVCKEMKLKHSGIFEVSDNVYLEVYKGEVLTTLPIKPRGRSSYSDSLAHLSLGKSRITTDESRFNDFSVYGESYGRTEIDPIERFFSEVEEEADHSWVFIESQREISLGTFLRLSDEEKLDCLVIRADGTVCSPDETLNGTLYEGGLTIGGVR